MKDEDITKAQLLKENAELKKQIRKLTDTAKNEQHRQKKLLNQEKLYKTFFDSIGLGVSVINKKMQIVELNKQMQEQFPSVDVREKPICYQAYKNPPSQQRCSYCPTFKTFQDGQVHEAISNTFDGNETKYYRIIASPVNGSNGDVEYVIKMVDDITDNLFNVIKLKEKDQLLEAVFESTRDGILVVNNENRITHFSGRFLEMWKIPDEYTKENNDDKFLSYVLDQLKDPDAFLEKVKKLYQSKEKDFDTIYFKDGRVFERYSSSLINEGKIIGRIWNFHDITSQVKAETKLSMEKAYFEQLFHNSPEAIVLADNDGKVKRINKEFSAMFGYTERETENKSIDELIVPNDMTQTARELTKNAQEGKTVAFETVRRCKDDRLIDVSILGAPIKIGNKQMGVLGIYRDISERKRIEEQIKSSEERLNILFKYAPDAYYLNDSAGRFVEGNEAAEKLIGYKKGELIGKSFAKLRILPFDQIPKALAILANNKRGKSSGPDDFTLVRKDDKKVEVEIRTYVVNMDGENLVLGIARDITERKNAEKKLKKLLNEKEILLKEVHHRVKNNFQVISSLLNLQLKNIKDQNALTAFKVSQNRIRTMALIHEKLYQSSDLGHINFAEYIKTLTFNLYRSYVEIPNKIDLQFDVEDVLLDLDRAIPSGLILNELITNALKYAFPVSFTQKGILKISLHEKGKHKVVMTIKDNGIGLPENLNIKNTKSLGLKLVTMLFESQLDGKIKINTENGTEFQIRFNKSG